MKDELDNITYGEYKRRSGNESKGFAISVNTKSGLDKEKLLNIIQLADKSNIKMFVWVSCLQNYVRVYRNSMVDSIHKCKNPEKLTVRKEYKELYFR